LEPKYTRLDKNAQTLIKFWWNCASKCAAAIWIARRRNPPRRPTFSIALHKCTAVYKYWILEKSKHCKTYLLCCTSKSFLSIILEWSLAVAQSVWRETIDEKWKNKNCSVRASKIST